MGLSPRGNRPISHLRGLATNNVSAARRTTQSSHYRPYFLHLHLAVEHERGMAKNRRHWRLLGSRVVRGIWNRHPGTDLLEPIAQSLAKRGCFFGHLLGEISRFADVVAQFVELHPFAVKLDQLVISLANGGTRRIVRIVPLQALPAQPSAVVEQRHNTLTVGGSAGSSPLAISMNVG